jgi:hypothetical protein
LTLKLYVGLPPPLVGVAVKVTDAPEQIVVPRLEAILTDGETLALIEILAPLSEPMILGLLLTTLILYPLPLAAPPGIVAEMVPLEVDVSVPIFVGLAKLPLLLLNCAVKTLPELKVPVAVKGTLTDAPAQNGEPTIVPVLIVLLGVVQLTVDVLMPGPKIVISILLQPKEVGVAEAQSDTGRHGLVVVVKVPV